MKKGDLFNVENGRTAMMMVRYTGEIREPKKGEWYISGAIPEGYIAPNNLSCKYHIGELVKVQKTITYKVIN